MYIYLGYVFYIIITEIYNLILGIDFYVKLKVVFFIILFF